MSAIPTSLTEKAFNEHIRPYISVAKRGYERAFPCTKSSTTFSRLPREMLPISPSEDGSRQKEISYHAVYYHYRKWSRDGSLEKVWQGSVLTIEDDLNLSELNLDGMHAIAKKGGEAVAYQGRKKAKTTNVLPVTDGNGFIVASTDCWQETTTMLTISNRILAT